jgi:OmcA/MtrC family decaheme c-type cytochrome
VTTAAPRITITGATVNASGHVVASYTVTQGGDGLGGDTVRALAPSWTLAGLSVDPVTADAGVPVPAWQSYLLTGQTIASLPIDGPGTPDPFVLTSTRQPGSDAGGAIQDLGGGSFTYTFAATLPAPTPFDPSQWTTTLRVGVWLGGTPGTSQTTSTFDFVPSGGSVQSRELVLDANCSRCHGLLQAHGGFRTGVKICLTCHTFQNADPDTVDPAALLTSSASTNPNPLDLGRLVHRIHRGKNLPTLYAANPPSPGTASHPNVGQPFYPDLSTPSTASRKYSVVGYQSRESVFGQLVTRTDNGQLPGTTIATGVRFPQDLRNCDACHGGAAQAAEHFNDISRRTCYGCHADVWFEGPDALWNPSNLQNPDAVHFLHPGGPQTDDSQCAGCHLGAGTDADITVLHFAPSTSPYWNGITAKIVSVQNLKPGQSPTVVFTVADRDGSIDPLTAPTLAMDADLADSGAYASPVPRALQVLNLTISGPTGPDYVTGNFASSASAPVSESALGATSDGSGHFTYTFAAKVPAGASGTWAVALEAGRSDAATATTQYYDPGSDMYSWPFTPGTVTEYADNPVVYVDVGSGSLGAGSPSARRQVVSRDRCDACHQSLSAHGGLRRSVEYCVMCHAADASDWASRPLSGAVGSQAVILGATYDVIEERSIHFRSFVHRIHTGDRVGSAELDLARPFVVYDAGLPRFFDDVRFPNDLANCALCHVSGTNEIEAVPSGARSTVANETASLVHAGTAAPVPGEESVPPVQAACLGCHDTGAAQLHARENTVSGVEGCALCHGIQTGLLSVDTVHGPMP